MTALSVPVAPVWLEVVPPELAGGYGYINRCLRLSDGSCHGIPGLQLLEKSTLLAEIGEFARLHPGCDHSAIVSMWFQIYLEMLLPPVFAASYVKALKVPVDLPSIRAIFTDEGCLVACSINSDGGPATGDPFERFDLLFRTHLVPLIEAIAKHAAIAPRLLWANVGACLAAIATVVAHTAHAPSEAVAAADDLLSVSTWPDGWANPLARTVRFESDGDRQRLRNRRICCLRYKLPDYPICDDCPRPLRAR